MDSTDDNRSWAEICDEELSDEESRLIRKYEESFEEGEIRDNSFVVPEPVRAEKSESSKEVPSSAPTVSRSPSPESIDSEDVNGVKPVIRNKISYAKAVSSQLSSAPRNVQPNLYDDLSLTSHLDVFHVDSPQKKIDSNEQVLDILVDENAMFSPCKSTPIESNASKKTKRPFMLIDSPARETRDKALHFPKIAKSKEDTDVHTKSKSSASSTCTKRELEVNPEILCRRQKQIDYGKNTLGYERYTKLVPKEERSKEDPKTPPKQLQMSRRAWDGLIKNWRMKLHKWDPVSEGDKPDLDNANFDRYSFSSEDPSSYDSSSVRSDSTVSTPKKCLSSADGEEGRDAWGADREQTDPSGKANELWSRKCVDREETGTSEKANNRWSHRRSKNDKSEDDYLGCEPLTENCVKACS